MKEIDILFPKSKYDGTINISVIKNGNIKNLGFYNSDNINKRIDDLQIYKSFNYYISANKFKRFTKRKTENLFSLNNIVIDCDVHIKCNKYERINIVDKLVWILKRDLFNISEEFRMPVPNLIHYTGRGVQIWWHIDEIASQLIWLYKIVIEKMISVIEDVLSEYPDLNSKIEIDKSASLNAAGLYRLFNTYNTKVNNKTETEIFHEGSYNLNYLNKSLEKFEEISDANSIENSSLNSKSIEKRKKKVCQKSAKITKNNYYCLNLKRIELIKFLVKHRENHIGCRNNMIFLAFNSALQIYSFQEAKKLVVDLNNYFCEPLKKINYIFDEIKTPYKFTNSTFFKILDVTEEEYKKFSRIYGSGKPNATRDYERRERKNIMIVKKNKAKQMLLDGFNYDAIVKKTGLSKSTIYRLKKDNEK